VRRIAILLLLVTSSSSLRAKCVEATSYLVEIEVSSCVVAFQKGGVELSGARRGAIVSAQVFGQVELPPSASRVDSSASWKVDRFEQAEWREYFYLSNDAKVCADLTGRGRFVLMEYTPCCDVNPDEFPVCSRRGLAELPEWLWRLLKTAPNHSLEQTHQTVIKFACANLSPVWRAAQLSC